MDDTQPFKGGPDKLNKPELVRLAEALKLDSEGTIAVLRPRIKAHLSTHSAELSTQPRFQGLYTYRPPKTKRGHEKIPGKTSLDKANEDAGEGAKAVEATGAFKALLDTKVAHDPPPRHTRLNTQRAADHREKEAQAPVPIEEPLSPCSSPSPSVFGYEVPAATHAGLQVHDSAGLQQARKTPVTTPHPIDAAAPVKAIPNGVSEGPKAVVHGAGVRESDMQIVVALQHEGGEKGYMDEIFVPDSGALLERREIDGEDQYTVQLTQLLPAVVENASTPIKRRGGRLYRSGLTNEGGRIAIGTVQAIIDGSRVPQLGSKKVNTYRLEPVPGEADSLLCRLFLREDPDLGATQKQAGPTRPPPERVSSPESPTPARRVDHARGSRVATHSKLGQDAFIEYLRDLLEGPKSEWKKAKTVGDILKRVKALEKAMAIVEALGWEKSRGGYQIPDDYDEAGRFAGRAFLKDDILKALHLGHSQANTDAQLFKPEVLRKIEELQAWYKKSDGPQAQRFQHMTIKQFETFRDRELQRLKEQKTRKRSKSKSSEAAQGDGAPPAKKAKKAKEPVKVLESDDLDDSDDDDCSD